LYTTSGLAAFGGENVMFYFLQATTALILVLATNTAFADFPRLASILAKDGFMPHQFAFRGERLALSNGIVVLAAIAGVLLVIFGADTHKLIPLYAIGVFIAFTLSQSGMVLHWRKTRGSGWRRSMVINGFGAVATFVVTIIVAATKFTHGAWIVLILMPSFAFVLYQINRHYRAVEKELAVPDGVESETEVSVDRPVIVLVGEISQPTATAVLYARSISTRATAVHVVAEDGEAVARLEARWQQLFPDVPLMVIESSFGSLEDPLLAFIDTLNVPPNVPLTIVVPALVPSHWWEGALHNQTSRGLRSVLRHRPNTIVVDLPHVVRRN
jgi:hypothetical protein